MTSHGHPSGKAKEWRASRRPPHPMVAAYDSLRVGRVGLGDVWFQLEISHFYQLLELLVDQVLEAMDPHRGLLLHEPDELSDEQGVLLLELVLQRLDQRVREEDGEVHGGDRDGREADDPAKRQGAAHRTGTGPDHASLLRAEDLLVRLGELPPEKLCEHDADTPQLRDEEPVQRHRGLLPSASEADYSAGNDTTDDISTSAFPVLSGVVSCSEVSAHAHTTWVVQIANIMRWRKSVRAFASTTSAYPRQCE
eukprot:CAMPEP_0118819808 /NCGR_PEP_ID=MMETSP1162-20130426/7224_1 /TAXON_ID=33656 /ORGANISM="Phaeocystis Sp, Strain CCMP2710" /LENGTH=251 /DNA_ID=CAMNT_0006750125 /DNA_START=200 /DNA_END=959 /DNA_ORIENTATION=+